MRKTVVEATCVEIGIAEGEWHNFESIGDSTLEERTAWLEACEQEQVALAR